MGVNGEAADDPHRRRQDSDLEDASSGRSDVAAETGIDKFLENHNKGSVTAMTRPNEVTVYTVRVGCERFEVCRFGVCSLKCHKETAEITLLNSVDWTRRVKTIPPNTTRYSHESLGHCESSIKKVEKQKRVFISHAWRADHQCDSERHVAWTITQRSVNAEELRASACRKRRASNTSEYCFYACSRYFSPAPAVHVAPLLAVQQIELQYIVPIRFIFFCNFSFSFFFLLPISC